MLIFKDRCRKSVVYRIWKAHVYRQIRSVELILCDSHWMLLLLLTPEHRRNRLEWRKEQSLWNQKWNTTVFSDESHDGWTRVRSRRT